MDSIYLHLMKGGPNGELLMQFLPHGPLQHTTLSLRLKATAGLTEHSLLTTLLFWLTPKHQLMSITRRQIFCTFLYLVALILKKNKHFITEELI